MTQPKTGVFAPEQIGAWGKYTGAVRSLEPSYQRLHLRSGILTVWVLVLAVSVFFVLAVVGTLFRLPPIPTEADSLVEARAATLTWGKDIIQLVTASFAPILAALIGYLFGSRQDQMSNSDE